MPATTAIQASPPARPIVPRPLWQRDALFQEPVYAAGLESLEGEDEDDSDFD